MRFSLSSLGLRGKVAAALTAFAILPMLLLLAGYLVIIRGQIEGQALAGMQMQAIMVGDALDQTLVERFRDLDAATAEKVAEIKISDAGKTIVVKRDATGTWHVPAYYDFPADFQKIARFVGELTEAKLTRLVTT
eukprot:gene26066-26240_t